MIHTDKESLFWFFGVGQGLFHAGIIDKGDGSFFSFVYDCGATEKNKDSLKSSILAFKSKLMQYGKDNHLDLLIVSHFHDDHISGLPDLLSGMTVGKVILPYTTSSMILIYLRTTKLLNDNRFLTFFENPDQAIRKWSENVSYVVHLSERELNKNNNEMPLSGEPCFIEDREKRLIISAKQGFSLSKLEQMKHGSYIINGGSVSFDLCLRYKFRFAQNPDLLLRSDLYRRYDSIMKVFTTKYSNRKIIENDKLLQQLRQKKLSGFLNKTSVICFYETNYPVAIHIPSLSYSSDFINEPLKVLLVGDCPITKTIIQDYRQVDVYQVSHHGGRGAELFPSSVKVAVLSYGTHNPYKHPKSTVIEAGKRVLAGDMLVHVIENRTFAFRAVSRF